jgi:hypothetical protein
MYSVLRQIARSCFAFGNWFVGYAVIRTVWLSWKSYGNKEETEWELCLPLKRIVFKYLNVQANICIKLLRFCTLSMVLFLFKTRISATSPIDWAQLSRFHLKTESESSPRKVVCFNKNRAMVYVQKHDNCVNIPSSRTSKHLCLLNIITLCVINAATLNLHKVPCLLKLPVSHTWLVHR